MSGISRLLSLPAELREHILEYILEPKVVFTLTRDGEIVGRPDYISVAYTIAEPPIYTQLVHPILRDDVKTVSRILRSRVDRIVSASLKFPEDSSRRHPFPDNPSSSFIHLCETGRFILDIMNRRSIDTVYSLPSRITSSIRYLGINEWDSQFRSLLARRLRNCETFAMISPPRVSTSVLYTEFVGSFVAFQRSDTDEGAAKLSRVEYIYGRYHDFMDEPRMKPGLVKLHKEIPGLACFRRRLTADELIQRGRAIIRVRGSTDYGFDPKAPVLEVKETIVFAYDFEDIDQESSVEDSDSVQPSEPSTEY